MPRRIPNKRIATKRYVHKVLKDQLERKVHDEVAAVTFADPSGVVHNLGRFDLITNGTLFYNQRVGTEIELTSVRLTGCVSFGITGALPLAPFGVCRIVLFQWFGNEGVDPPITSDVLYTYDNATPGTYMYSQYSKNPGQEFRVLKDKYFALDPINTPQIYFDWLITDGFQKKLDWHDTRPAEGEFYIILISDIDESEFIPCELEYVARFTYTDA